MCAAACPGCTYSVSTAVIPSGWRKRRGVGSVAGRSSIPDRVAGEPCITPRNRRFSQQTISGKLGRMIRFLSSRRAATALAMCAFLLAMGPEAHAQPFSVPTHRVDGTLVFDGIPPVDATLASRLTQYEEWRQARFLDWLPNGSMLVATRFGTESEVHRVASPLGMREQLTFGDGSVIEARAPHSGAGFVFVRQTDGYPQLFNYP